MVKYLVDTCVWKDYFEERTSTDGKPFSSYAELFFNEAISKKWEILFSDSLVHELNNHYSVEEINRLLGFLTAIKILKKIEITKEQFKEARILSKKRTIPLGDCINAVQARDYKLIIITQDNHYFNNLSDIAKSKRPQEVIQTFSQAP